MNTIKASSSGTPPTSSGTPPTFTVLNKIGELKNSQGKLVEEIFEVERNDGRRGILTFNHINKEGTFVVAHTGSENLSRHDFQGVFNRNTFNGNYTAAPTPRDPLVIDLDGNGQFQLPIDWIQNQRGDKRYLNTSNPQDLNTSNPQGSGDGVLAYKDPTTGELHLFRDAIDGKGQSYHNAIEHLRALKDQQKNGVIEGKELEGIYLLRADGSAVPAEQVIKSIRLDYENVNEQGGLVRQKAKLAVELIDGRRFDMANVWPEANTLESVNTGIPPEALGNPELQARLANIPNIHSTGNTIPDLRFAAAKDPVLLERIEALQRKIANRQEVTQAEWDGVVFRWTGVEAVTGSSFGMDNKRIQALRRLLSHEEGVAFGADGHGVQSQAAASSLNGQFDRFLERFKLLFAGRVRSKTESALYNIAFDPNTSQSLRTGATITTTNQTKIQAVTDGQQGQVATTGSGENFFVINWYKGKINGITNQDGNVIYGSAVNLNRDGQIDMSVTLREQIGANYEITNGDRTLIYRGGPEGTSVEANSSQASTGDTGGSSLFNWIPPFLALNPLFKDKDNEKVVKHKDNEIVDVFDTNPQPVQSIASTPTV